MGQAVCENVLNPPLRIQSMEQLEQVLPTCDVICVYGSDIEPLYKACASWLKKEENRFLLVVEDDEQKFLQSKECSFAKDPKVRILYYKIEDTEIFSHIAWEFVFLRFAYLSSSPSLQNLAHNFFTQLEHFYTGVHLLASDCEDMGLKVLRNVVHNLAMLPEAKLGQSLEGACAHMPAIVCGAGPSLNASIPSLSALHDKALLIAGGTAVPALKAQGITPHLIAHMDPDPPRERFRQQECVGVPFFYQSRFCHGLLKHVHAPLIWFPDSGNYPLEAWASSECGIFSERFDAGWTVANFCTAIAEHLGCSPIIFVGMDFSCEKQTPYASGIAGKEHRDSLIEIEKDKLYSRKDWLMSAEWMRAFAEKKGQTCFINATAGGIDIPGIERRMLAEISDSLHGQWDIPGIVHALVMRASSSGVNTQKVQKVRDILKQSFHKSLELCDQLLKVWEKYYPQSALEKGEYILLEHELEQEIAHVYFLSALWNVWKKPILRTHFHVLGQHVHQLLFFKKALETHLSYLRSL